MVGVVAQVGVVVVVPGSDADGDDPFAPPTTVSSPTTSAPPTSTTATTVVERRPDPVVPTVPVSEVALPNPPSPDLPRTGTDPSPLFAAALLLIVIGIVLIAAAHTRLSGGLR